MRCLSDTEEAKVDDWSKRPANCAEKGWYFARVESTETRGIAHYHILLHLPNVLSTSLLGRVIQNSRLVRNELKRGNVKKECLQEAWHVIEMGLLAQQYAINGICIDGCIFYETDTFGQIQQE